MVKIVCIGQQGLDPQHKLNVFVVKVWIKSSFPHIVGNVSVGPLARRGLSSWILDIYYLFEVRYIEYRYGLLYTVIITENYNQFYHRPTLTQRSARRIDSHLGDAIQIISPSNQKSQHCRNIFWVKCWQLYHDRVFAWSNAMSFNFLPKWDDTNPVLKYQRGCVLVCVCLVLT